MGKKISIFDRMAQTTEPQPKRILDRVLDNTTPMRSGDVIESEVGQGFEGDSSYDQNLAYGVDQSALRARNQPFLDEVTNAVVKTVPGVGLGIVENAGYLGELLFDWDKNKDYSNAFTELAQKGREKLEGALPAYRENPNETFDLKDTAWWVNNGQGLIESVGEFLVTGQGVGGVLSKSAKALATSIKAGQVANTILQGGAQLGTASALAYTEGAMSGALVYKDVLEQTGDPQKASDAAARTVYLNTIINTGLNVTSIAPLFRSGKNLEASVASQLSRKAKESTKQYVARLNQLEAQGVTQAGILKTLASEATQEGLEEEVNLFAENEGRITGGIKESKGSALDRFIQGAFTEEGALNFILGAVGGVAQTAGMEYLPIKSYIAEDGTQKRTSARNLDGQEKSKYQKETISTFKNDIEYLQTNQEALTKAVEAKDKAAIELAKNNLFNIAALKSIRNETTEELATEISSLAQVDNTIVRENGLTDAQAQGLTDNVDDNSYKDKAIRKASDLRQLNKEFRNLNAWITNPHTAAEAFRRRMDVYSASTVAEDFNIAATQKETSLPNFLPLEIVDAAKYKAEVEAYDAAILFQEAKGRKKEADLLRSESTIVRSLYNDLIKEKPDTATKLEQAKGIIQPLVSDYANKLVMQQAVQKFREAYNEVINNPKAFEKKLDKEINDLTKKADKAKEEKAKQDDLIQKQVNIDAAKRKKEEAKEVEATKLSPEVTTTQEILPEVSQQTSEQGLDSGIEPEELRGLNYDGEPTYDDREELEELQKMEDELNATAVEQLEAVNPIDTSYQGKSNVDAKEEAAAIEEIIEQVNNENNSTYGDHNKIAYKAQEQDQSGKTIDPTTINDLYKTLHKSTFGEGTSVTLKVDTESTYYEENKDSVQKVPIGVYYNNELVGYLPTYKSQQKDLLLVRNQVVKSGEVKTNISKKTTGVLNRGQKGTVIDNLPKVPKFGISIGGTLHIGVEVPYRGNLINKTALKTGFVYTINKTPNGTEIALPTDITKISEQVADSVVRVLDIFIKGDNLTDQNREIVNEIFDKYGFDITSQKGLQEYVNQFIYTTDLSDNENVIKLNLEQKDNYYVQVSPNGIRFMRSGGAIKNKQGVIIAREIGKNTPNPEKFYNDLKKHLQNTYFRVDLARLTSKKPFEVPILQNNPDSTLAYTQYYKANYAEHVATNTTTNVIGVKLNENEETVFVQPSLFLDYSFLTNTTEKSSIIIDENTAQKAILAPGKKGLKGLTKSLPLTKKDPNQVTLEDANKAIEDCK